jgi:hypothetical protein
LINLVSKTGLKPAPGAHRNAGEWRNVMLFVSAI